MNDRLYDILYSGYNQYSPQSMSEIIDLQVNDQIRAENARRMQGNIELLNQVDRAEEDRTKSAQANILEQTRDGLDLSSPVAVDIQATILDSQNKAKAAAMQDRLLFINASEFSNSYRQTMAAADHGGFVGPSSQRAVSARYGGSMDFGYAFGHIDKQGLANMVRAGAEHGTLEGESPLDKFDTGWPVLELIQKSKRGVEDSYYWWEDLFTRNVTDPNEMRTDFSGGSDLPGTPLYNLLHVADPSWTKDKKDALIAEFQKPELQRMAQMIGLTSRELERTRSFGHAMVMLNTKVKAFEAAQYGSTASGYQMFGEFMTNLGATIISDPEMLAEFTLTLGSSAVVGTGIKVASVGNRLINSGNTTVRAVSAAETIGKTSGIAKILEQSRRIGAGIKQGTGVTLSASGTVVARAGGALGAANPFTIGERIVWPAFSQARALSKAGTLYEKTETGKLLRKAVAENKYGATGVLLRNVVFNNTDTTLKGTLLSAMVDGGFQNYLAYAYTRDEEWAFTQAAMGDSADAAHIAYQFYRGDSFMNFMNSGLGAYTLGLGFGSIMGLGMKAIAINAIDIPNRPEVEGMDLPILKNPVQAIKRFSSNLKARLEANAKNIADSSASFAASVAEGGINNAKLASLHIQGVLAKSGTLTREAVANLDSILVAAMLQGVNLQKLARKAVSGGTVDFTKIKQLIISEMKTPEARARRRVMKGRKTPAAMGLAAQAFNTARIQYAIDNGLDFGEGGHLNALNRLIDETEEGPIKFGLITLRNNVATFTDDVLDLIKENIRGWDNWDALDPVTKQRVIDDAVAAADLEGVTIKLSDFDATVRTVSGKDVAARRATERNAAKENFEAFKKAQEAAEAAKIKDEDDGYTATAGLVPEDIDTMNRNELNAFIDDNGIPGGKGGTNDAKRQRIRDWATTQEADPVVEGTVRAEAGEAEAKDTMDAVDSDRAAAEENKQMEFTYTDRDASEIAREIAAEQLLRDSVQEGALRDLVDGPGIEALAVRGGEEKLAIIDMNMTNAQVRHLIDLSKAQEADARRAGIDLEWNLKEVVRLSKEKADKVRAISDTKDVDNESNTIIEDIPKKGRGEELKRLIYKEFGMDLKIGKDEGRVVGSATVKDIEDLYRDLRMLRHIANISEEAKAKLAADPILAVAVGKSEDQAALARTLVENLRALSNIPRTSSRISAQEAVAAMPHGFEGLLHTVFADAEIRVGDEIYFDLSAMRLEAERRLAYSDENFRKAYIEEANKRSAELEPAEREIIDSLLQFHNDSAATRAFFERRTGANARAINHRERVEARLKPGETIGDYLARENKKFVMGVVEGWSAIPQGAFKDALARRLGIVDLVNQKRIFTLSDNTEKAINGRKELATRIWVAAHEEAGMPVSPAYHLWNGTTDSQRGFVVGRALIEAVTGQVSPDAIGSSALADVRATTGYIGRMTNTNFVRMFQKNTREAVVTHVLGMGSGRIDGTTLRYLTADDVEFIIKDLEAIRDSLKSGKLTPEIKARLNRVGYEAHERLTLAPKSTLKDLNKKISSVRKFIEDEIQSVMDTPPGHVNMLHDEMSIGKAVQDIMFLKGDTGSEVRTLDPSVSGDIGLKSAIATPGSWKDIWNLRSEAIFGSTEGFSRIASYLGLKNLEKAIQDYDGDIIRFIRDLEKMNNAEDASSQAVTMAQAIFRDFGDGDKAQANFREVLQKLNYLFNEQGGLDKVKKTLDEVAREVESRYLADPDSIDKYSQVALRFLRERPPSDAWAKLFALTRTSDDAKTLNTVSAGDADIAGEIGKLLRKKIFKPPVMTIVYGAGAPAFRKSIMEGLEDIAEVLARRDPNAAERFRRGISDMANDLVDEIVTNDLIRDELGIPTSQKLIQMFRARPLSDKLTIRNEDGSVQKVYTVEDIVSGEWLTGPNHNAVMQHLMQLSKDEFKVASPELGLWYAKLLVNNDGKRLKRAVANMKKKILKAMDDETGELNIEKLNEQFTPINTYLSSIDSANRLGFLADNEIVRRQMERLDISEEDLDPITAHALNHHVALYQHTGPAAGRKFGFFDGPTIVRNQNPETEVGEVLGMHNESQIGQVTLDDGFRQMMGLADADLETKVRDGVVKQLLIELGAVLAPPRLPDGLEFKYPTVEGFYRGIYAMEDMGNPAARRMDARDVNEARIQELSSKPKSALTKKEAIELAELKAFLQVVYGRDEDGKIRLTSGNSLLAGNIRSEAHFDVHSEETRPTTLGVPYLQQLAFSVNDATIRMSTFDAETQKGIGANVTAFKPEEVTAASPLHPEFIAKAREAQPSVTRTAESDQEIASTMGQRTQQSLDAEKAAERSYAEEKGLEVNGVRLTRLVRRLEKQMETEIRYITNRYSGEEREARLKGVRRRFLAKIQRGWENTTGSPMSSKEPKRNAFKVPKKPVRYKTRGDLTLLEALQEVIRDNDIRELAGLMMGPSERLGIDLRRAGQMDNIMPFSSARGPMTVFALDWYLMGGTSRDHMMYSIARMADAAEVEYDVMIRRVKENGFSVEYQRYIADHYDNLSDSDNLERFFMDGERYKGLLDDRFADEFKIEVRSISDQIDAEFGIEMPPLPRRFATKPDEKIRFIGVMRYLQEDPERVRYINEVTGLELTAEQIALNFSLSREKLLELAEADDPTSVFIPRQQLTRQGGVIDSKDEVDRINSRDIVDENVRPDQMPLFSYDQITHLLNMPANKNFVAYLILHQMTGLDINTQMRLDNKVRDAVDGFSNGEEPHGFASNPRSQTEAEALIDEDGGASLYGIGVIARNDYGLRPPVTPDGKPPKYDFITTVGAAQLIHSFRMAKNGSLTPEGITLLKRLEITEPEQVRMVLRYSEEIKNKLAEIEDFRTKQRMEEAAQANAEAIRIEDERINAERGYEEPEGPSPFRDDEGTVEPEAPAAPETTTISEGRVEETPLPASPDAEDAKGSFIDISSDTRAERTDAGEAFRHLLFRKADRGSAASRNVLNMFDAMTGRDGQAKAGEAISDAEAMSVLEVAFVDKDISRALFGGDMTIEFDGHAHVEIIAGPDNQGGRMRTMFRGLAEVNQKIKEGRVDSAVYVLLHELVERLDLGHAITGRGIDDVPSRNKVKSAIGTHFITNFGTKQARDKWVKILKGLGAYDEQMKAFIKRTELFFEAEAKRQATAMDEDLYEARKNLMTVHKDEKGYITRTMDPVIVEGYTQALTLALFSRNIDRLGEDSPIKGLSSVAGYLKEKLHKMVDFLTHYGIDTEPKRGASLGLIAGSQAKRGKYQDQLLLQLQLMSRNLDWDEIVTHEHAGMSTWGEVRGPDGRMVRHWGGGGTPPEPKTAAAIKAELAAVEAKLPTANRFTRHALQIRADKLRNELGLAMIDPDAIARDLEAAKAKGDAAKDERGLIDSSRFLTAAERQGVENAHVDSFLAGINAQRSTGMGRVFNWLAGKLVSGEGSFAGNNSEFAPVRAVFQLMNPEIINGKLNNYRWIPDQVAASNLGRDLSKAIHNLDWYRSRIKRLKGAELREFQMNFDAAMRTHKKEVRQRIYQTLGLNQNEINKAEYWHAFMFDPDYGFVDRMARRMVDVGIISEAQHASFRDVPGLSMQLIRDAASTTESHNTIRNTLKTLGRDHLRRRAAAGMYEVMLLEANGAFMQRGMISEAAIKANFDDLDDAGRTMFLRLADKMQENGIEVSTVEHIRAYQASEFLRTEMKRPKEKRADWSSEFVSNKYISDMHAKALDSDEFVPTYHPDGTRNVEVSRAELLMSTRDSLEVFKPKTGLDLMAQLELEDLKTGGKLGDSRLIGNRARALVGSDIEGYLDFDIQNQLNSFIGSNSMMAAGTAVQQHAIGIRGANTMFLIDNLLHRLKTDPTSIKADDGSVITGIQRDRMEKELLAAKNQIRAGYNLRPIGVEPDTDLTRSLKALSRIGVSIVSAGNFALSAVVEILAGLPRTLGKLMYGDLKAIGDYFTMLSPAARKKIMENADGFEVVKMHLGIHTRFGDLGYDDIRDMTGYDKSANWISMDGLEKISRKLSGVAMFGFSGFTEYARAISVAQAVRHAKRVSANKHGGYGRLGKELAKLSEDATAKDVRAVAREIGMDGQEAVYLWQAGLIDPDHLTRVNELLQSRYYTEHGMNVDAIFRDNAFDEYEMATVRAILQFQNNKINLDPRMGSKIVPQDITRQLISVLGQFPLLFYSRMRQAAYQGGGMAVGSFLLFMLLGEMYYTNLALMARGEHPSKILERLTGSDPGWILNTLENMNVMGASSPVLSYLMQNAVSTFRDITDNPDALDSYKASIMRNPVGLAGLEMLKSGVVKTTTGTSNMFAGNYDQGLTQLASAVPLPFKQLIKTSLHVGLADTQVGRTLSNGMAIPRPGTEALTKYDAARAYRDSLQGPQMRSEPLAEQRGMEPPPERQTKQEAPEASTKPKAPEAQEPPDLLKRLDQQEGSSPNLVERIE